jgi:hypothetical protein
MDAENEQWNKFSESLPDDTDDYEHRRLMNEHFARYDVLDRECAEELEKVRGVKKKEDWWLFAFYYSIAFISFGLIGILWDYVFAWVMTLRFVKGNEWYAYGAMIGGILVSISLIASAIEEIDKRKSKH